MPHKRKVKRRGKNYAKINLQIVKALNEDFAEEKKSRVRDYVVITFFLLVSIVVLGLLAFNLGLVPAIDKIPFI